MHGKARGDGKETEQHARGHDANGAHETHKIRLQAREGAGENLKRERFDTAEKPANARDFCSGDHEFDRRPAELPKGEIKGLSVKFYPLMPQDPQNMRQFP